MLHTKAVDRCRKVVSDLFLLGIEADALTDDHGVGLAGGAPDGERHFETDREDAEGGFAGAGTKSMSVRSKPKG